MRKLVVLLLFLLLFFGSIYIFIPNKISIRQERTIPVSAKAFFRTIPDETKWQKWWPGEKPGNNDTFLSFTYNGNKYKIIEKKYSSLVIAVKNSRDSLITELVFIPVTYDTVEINWFGQTTTTFNPVTRIQKFQWAKSLRSDLDTLLQKLESFYANEDNLYEFPIKKGLVVDSTLVSTSATLKSYPTTEIIYKMIDRLKVFAQKNGAKETGLPMLNITVNKDSTYLTKVALPVDKILKDEGDIHYRWMLGGGNILVAEVKGGPYQIQKAFYEMEKYVNDHRRIAPAIPFQSLVTERRKEPDTSKWITKIYWPVM